MRLNFKRGSKSQIGNSGFLFVGISRLVLKALKQFSQSVRQEQNVVFLVVAKVRRALLYFYTTHFCVCVVLCVILTGLNGRGIS